MAKPTWLKRRNRLAEVEGRIRWCDEMIVERRDANDIDGWRMWLRLKDDQVAEWQKLTTMRCKDETAT